MPMFKLKKLHPPFGTRDAPIYEPAYAEEAVVVDGNCEVRLPETRDYLLKMGYCEEVEDGQGQEVPETPPSPQPAVATVPRRSRKPKRRR